MTPIANLGSTHGAPACPRCASPLFEGKRGNATLLGCGQCGGVWLDSDACRQIVGGAGKELTELAETAAAHASVAPPSAGPLACPACGTQLARGSLPGPSIELDMCGAHGTWFDRGELRLVSLAYANLPPPLEFHKEDYAPLQPPNPGIAVSLSIQGVEVAAFGPGRLDRSEDPAYFVRDTTFPKQIANSGVFEPMLAVAVAGAILCAALHVASLFGYTVVNGTLHVSVLVAVLALMGFGVYAHYRMNNAKTDFDGDLEVTDRQMRPWLTRLEYVAFLVVVFYGLIAALVLWPWPENPIVFSGGNLTVAEARAVWPCDLAFYVGSAALVQSARRLASQKRQAP